MAPLNALLLFFFCVFCIILIGCDWTHIELTEARDCLEANNVLILSGWRTANLSVRLKSACSDSSWINNPNTASHANPCKWGLGAIEFSVCGDESNGVFVYMYAGGFLKVCLNDKTIDIQTEWLQLQEVLCNGSGAVCCICDAKHFFFFYERYGIRFVRCSSYCCLWCFYS